MKREGKIDIFTDCKINACFVEKIVTYAGTKNNRNLIFLISVTCARKIFEGEAETEIFIKISQTAERENNSGRVAVMLNFQKIVRSR